MKYITFFLMICWSVSSLAQECATDLASLRKLVGNADISLNWTERNKAPPLKLKVGQSSGRLTLNLTKGGAKWADVTGSICKKGNNYVAKVGSMTWGPAAPGLVKGSSIKELNIKLPYQSELHVSVAVFKFVFNAN